MPGQKSPLAHVYAPHRCPSRLKPLPGYAAGSWPTAGLVSLRDATDKLLMIFELMYVYKKIQCHVGMSLSRPVLFRHKPDVTSAATFGLGLPPHPLLSGFHRNEEKTTCIVRRGTSECCLCSGGRICLRSNGRYRDHWLSVFWLQR